MTESELLHIIRIAHVFLDITSDLDARANLRGIVGECSSQIHRIRQNQAAKRREQK